MNLFVLIGLSILFMTLSCQSRGHSNVHHLNETAQSKNTFESFLLSDTEMGELINSLKENKEDFLSARTSHTRGSSGTLGSVSDDLVIVGRQLSLENNVRIFQSANRSCLLTYRYPEISGMRNELLQTEINRSFQRDIDDFAKGFRSYLEENKECTTPTDLDNVHLEIKPCELTFADQDLISILCKHIRSGRSAYPVVLSKGFTLNLRTGEIYTFGSLFNPGVNYQTNISQQLLAQDNWIGIDAELISDIQDDDEFYITSNCPGLPASSVCLGIPTNFTSGAARGRVLFIDIKEVGDILSSEEAIQALLD